MNAKLSLRKKGSGRRSFTLVEVLVAIAILAGAMVFCMEVIGQMGRISVASSARIDGFRNAQAVLSVVSRTLSRAVLNPYLEYTDANGNVLSPNVVTNYPNSVVPSGFTRSSDLHFLAGPASVILPGAKPGANPGGAVFFQAPLGVANDSKYHYLTGALNSVGFYVQYGSSSADDRMPAWLKSIFGTKAYRYMLVEAIEPTESLGIYAATAAAGTSYGQTWLEPFKIGGSVTPGIVAENVLLLVIRPRLAYGDEAATASRIGASFDKSKPGTVLAPNYAYDSRAWMPGYPAGSPGRVSSQNFAQRKELIRNQLPPIVDIALVCADPVSLARYEKNDEAPAELRVPSTLFVNGALFQEDLAAYGAQLDRLRIQYGIFQTSVQLKTAKWSGMPYTTSGF